MLNCFPDHKALKIWQSSSKMSPSSGKLFQLRTMKDMAYKDYMRIWPISSAVLSLVLKKKESNISPSKQWWARIYYTDSIWNKVVICFPPLQLFGCLCKNKNKKYPKTHKPQKSKDANTLLDLLSAFRKMFVFQQNLLYFKTTLNKSNRWEICHKYI